MSYPIPEDLRPLGSRLLAAREEKYLTLGITLAECWELIGRIARLEADKKALLEALDHIGNDGMDARQCMEMARAAIAQARKP